MSCTNKYSYKNVLNSTPGSKNKVWKELKENYMHSDNVKVF